MNIDKKLDLLKGVNPVEAPPFLLTRICQQISTLEHMEAPVQWKWAFAFTSLAVMVLNVAVLLKQDNTTIPNTLGIETIINSMNLASTNDFYNE